MNLIWILGIKTLLGFYILRMIWWHLLLTNKTNLILWLYMHCWSFYIWIFFCKGLLSSCASFIYSIFNLYCFYFLFNNIFIYVLLFNIFLKWYLLLILLYFLIVLFLFLYYRYLDLSSQCFPILVQLTANLIWHFAWTSSILNFIILRFIRWLILIFLRLP